MAQDPGKNEDGGDDLFAAMDFSAGEPADTGTDASAALDFSAATADVGAESASEAVDMSPVYAPATPEEATTVLEAIDSVTHAPEEAEDVIALFTVTNPPGTVSVSALGDGAIERVALSADVTRLTESQLAEEILVIAHLAAQRGKPPSMSSCSRPCASWGRVIPMLSATCWRRAWSWRRRSELPRPRPACSRPDTTMADRPPRRRL